MDMNLKLWIARMLSVQPPSPDGVEGERPRASPYDEPYFIPAMAKKYPSVDGGEYRTATMLPGATSLQLGISATFSAVAAAIAFQNSAQAASYNKRCYLDYIRMLVITAPTSATNLLAALVLDVKDRTPTTISNGAGGTGPGTPATVTAYKSTVFSPNMDQAEVVTVGVPFFPLSTAAGAPPTVPSAGQNARTIEGNISIRAQIPVAGDEYILDFGADNSPSSALLTAAPAGASRVVVPLPGCIVGPQQWALLHMWGLSNATAGIAFAGLTMGWWER